MALLAEFGHAPSNPESLPPASPQDSLSASNTNLRLGHTARHEASDPDGITFNHRHGPYHRSTRAVRFGDDSVVGNIDPVVLKAVIAVEAAVPHRPAQKTHHDPEGVAFEYEVLE